MRSPLRGLPFRLLPLLGGALLALAGEARAQSLGLEAGVAGVENYDPAPSLGVSLFLPLTDRFRGALSYSQWTGCDNNAGCEEPRVGYGNRGFNAMGLYRVVGTPYSASASIGAGVGWYERLRLRDGESDAYYEDALTFGGEIRFPVAFNSSTYLRADLSIPSDDHVPRWGFLRVGVDVGRF